MDAPRPTSDLAADVTEARRGIIASLIAVKGHLDQPYPDDDRWTPWTRFVEPAMGRLDESAKALVARVTDLEARLANAINEREEAYAEVDAAEAQVADLEARTHDDCQCGYCRCAMEHYDARRAAEAQVAALTQERDDLEPYGTLANSQAFLDYWFHIGKTCGVREAVEDLLVAREAAEAALAEARQALADALEWHDSIHTEGSLPTDIAEAARRALAAKDPA